MSNDGIESSPCGTEIEHEQSDPLCCRFTNFEIVSDDKALGINSLGWLANFRIARVKMRWHEWW